MQNGGRQALLTAFLIRWTGRPIHGSQRSLIPKFSRIQCVEICNFGRATAPIPALPSALSRFSILFSVCLVLQLQILVWIVLK